MSDRDTINVMTLDDPDRCGEFTGGEMIGVYQVFKEAKRQTKKTCGHISMFLPEDWIDPFIQASVGVKPKFNFLLIRLPVKDV